MNSIKCSTSAIFLAAVFVLSARVNGQSVMVTGQTAGPSPFIKQIQLTANPAASIKSIKFQITPKSGSVTRPVTATYPSEYLKRRGYYNSQTGAILLPVFGLYANFNNTVTLTYTFTDGSSQQATVTLATPVYNDSCGYTSPIIIQPRTNSTALSYDYYLVRQSCGNASPVIFDTDGQVRWIGTTGFSDFPAMLYQNSIYLGHFSNLYRMELDGTFSVLRDYSNVGVTNFHHNIDPGKRGMIVDVDTTAQFEAVNMEVDGLGNILSTWNLADIISAAMTAGGDDPTQFVKTASDSNPIRDWFHNNSVTYKKSDESLLVSSRENFVIALDYATGAIKWIFGDDTKQWFQFQSLRNFALTLGNNSLFPLGQHALSISSDDNLLLFDDGRGSLNHTPPGADRTYSAPRKYQINTTNRVATEVWSYPNNQSLYSSFCSSVYEDSPLNYVVDYAIITNITPPSQFAEILGLDASGNKVFDYRYAATNCDTAHNSTPIHLEQVVFSTIVPPAVVARKSHGAAGMFDIPLPLTGSVGVECRSGGASGEHQIVATFATPVTVTGATVTPGSNGAASVSGAPMVSGRTVTVNLTNVSNAQKITINLIGVNDGSNTENISVPMGVLMGDVTGNQLVNSSDISEVKLHAGAPVTASTFRRDVVANGSINSTDLSTIKSVAGSAIF